MSIEEKVEEYFKRQLSENGVRYYGKTESINDRIDNALKAACSKSGGSGNNYPDIKVLMADTHGRQIPVVIEAKGSKGKLEKIKDGEIEQVTRYPSDSKPDAKNPHKKGDHNFTTIKTYAVNGALHYGNALLDGGCDEVIIIGVNGTELDDNGIVKDPESRAYYVSVKNNRVPKKIDAFDKGLVLLKKENTETLFNIVDQLVLSDEELEELKKKAENNLDKKIKEVHQQLYEDEMLKTLLSTNEKLYLFCGLIMAGLSMEGLAPLTEKSFHGNDNPDVNDSTIIVDRIKAFLNMKKCRPEKVTMIMSLLTATLTKRNLWRPHNGETVIRKYFLMVKDEIVPFLESNLHLDFMGRILNSLSDWVSIENDAANDVVLTPRYVTNLMVKLCRTDRNSFFWDNAMGSGGFLTSAMDVMIRDAKDNIVDSEELKAKCENIKKNQLLGVEILDNIYILATLNMILMGDGSSNILNGDSLELMKHSDLVRNFPANVFSLNPPFSQPGRGLIFLDFALDLMVNGYAAILIQENAGSGQGLPYAKHILKNNTLLASIHMPSQLFGGKASVQTAIYLFKVGEPHKEDNLVKFIDFSEDGYTRQNRKKSSQDVNLRDTGDAKGRYAEIEAIILGKKKATDYYNKENGLVIEDTISRNGDDWTFSQHQVIDTTPTEEDFKKTVADYLAWRVSTVIKGN